MMRRFLVRLLLPRKFIDGLTFNAQYAMMKDLEIAEAYGRPTDEIRACNDEMSKQIAKYFGREFVRI